MKRVFKHPNAEEIFIKRVPKQTVKLFKEYADNGFCGDYGMALKQLLDFTLIFGPTIEGLQGAVVELYSLLEATPTEKEETPKRKNLKGQEIVQKR